MNMKLVVTTVLTLAIAAAGCAQQNSGMNGTGTGGVGGANSGYGNGSYGNNNGYGQNGTGGYGNGSSNGTYTPADLNNPNSILSQRVIYFDYDRAEIRPEYMNVVNAHAALLAAYPNLRVRLEGHADERGSREYNVALSERRGYSVLDYMMLKGTKVTQADVIGYGEEIPASFGHSEGSWSKNRRVEIRYTGE